MSAAVQRIDEVGTLAIDATNPWLGLASFSEETRQYFFGREDEVGELTRRVQRKLLTVLFGQSGLGKTSILRAGIVPRLREEGYCPVYVRVDYGPGVPAPSEQIKQAILRATSEIGTWTRDGVSQPDESLWEFLHHSGDELNDAYGEPLIPLLIFDQFEEIFTLAQTDNAGREHALAFVAALAELVENRPPEALEARLDDDEEAVAQFDFARTDYRVLIALREDYLAHLEGLKSAMPSITQNRMRLAPMTGTQALAAVSGPGGRLVTGEVAEAIVRFVAGGSELGNAQVEPSLLSLICRELNDKRIQAGRKEISLDLLAGSHASILTDFYERTLADQPAAVRCVIEDLLLTESGYRENVAEERVASALSAAGAAPGALALLVNRRLLRIEDRLDIRRVELTHDVLCGVVSASRAQRQEREQQLATERALADQAQREQATRKSLVRTRQVVAGCAALFFVASFASVFGYIKMNEAEKTRAMTQTSRAEAEKVVGYLMEDFYTELAPIGKVEMLGDLALRANTYYANLPSSMNTPETEMNRALTMMRLASILITAKIPGAPNELKLGDESVAIMTRLARAAPGSELVALNLSRVLVGAARVNFANGMYKQSGERLGVAVKAAAPFGERADASNFARVTYARALQRLGHTQMRNGNAGDAVKSLDRSLEVANVGSELPNNLDLTTVYIETAGFQMELLDGSKKADATKVGSEATAVAALALKRFPDNEALQALLANFNLQKSFNDIDGTHAAAALANVNASMPYAQKQLQQDPENIYRLSTLYLFSRGRGYALLSLGRVREGMAELQEGLDWYRDLTPAPWHSNNLFGAAKVLLTTQDELGQTAEMEKTRVLMGKYAAFGRAGANATALHRLYDVRKKLDILYGTKDLASIEELKSAGLQLIAENARAGSPLSAQTTRSFDMLIAMRKMEAIRDAGDDAALELLLRPFASVEYDQMDLFPKVELRISHALALARLGRKDESLKAMLPSVALLRTRLANGGDSADLFYQSARALYGTALAQDRGGDAALKEAAGLCAQLSSELQQFKSVKILRGQIAAEVKRRGMRL
ncbi:MAG: hypothetical protein V4723_09215 [Pseudomonadota bacterium]